MAKNDCTAKECTKCGVRKPIGDFYRRTERTYFSRCKACVSTDTKARKDAADSTRADRRVAKKRQELMGVKACPTCGVEKALTTDNWYRLSGSSTGFASSCKACAAAKQMLVRRKPGYLEGLAEADRLLSIGQKRCEKCSAVSGVAEFSKDKRRRDGLSGYCRSCVSIVNKQYRETHRDRLSKRRKEAATRDIAKNRERARIYRQKNRDMVLAKMRDWYHQNKDALSVKARLYRLENRERLQKQKRIYRRGRAEVDHVYAMKVRISGLIAVSLRCRNYTKKSRTHQILGCSYDFFVRHLEKQFMPGMSWDNRNEWHIDHIVPLASAQSEDDVIRLNHFTNLRPMWAKQNIAKASKALYLI